MLQPLWVAPSLWKLRAAGFRGGFIFPIFLAGTALGRALAQVAALSVRLTVFTLDPENCQLQLWRPAPMALVP